MIFLNYKLKIDFDAGSGTCLWAENTEAREKFGYAVDHFTLSLSENLRRWLDYLIAWYDTSIDWDYPAGNNEKWNGEEKERFTSAVRKAVKMLRDELSDEDFQIRNAFNDWKIK